METILCKDTLKQIWEPKKNRYQGTTKAKRVQTSTLANLRISRELVSEFFTRTTMIAIKMRVHGKKMEDVTIAKKILRSMTLEK